jgi:hypothetical protein
VKQGPSIIQVSRSLQTMKDTSDPLILQQHLAIKFRTDIVIDHSYHENYPQDTAKERNWPCQEPKENKPE